MYALTQTQLDQRTLVLEEIHYRKYNATNNTTVGYASLEQTQLLQHAAGAYVEENTTADNNTALGYLATTNTTGGSNTGTGKDSLRDTAQVMIIQDVVFYQIPPGSYNTAVGRGAINNNAILICGWSSLYTNTTGTRNCYG